MIERHITFNVHPDRTAEFERFFAEAYRPAMSASPGFVRVELLREDESPSRYQMALRFEDAESAAGWRNSAVHMTLQPALRALHAEVTIEVYQVIG